MKNKLLYQKLIEQERYRDKMRRIGEYKFTTRCNFHKTIINCCWQTFIFYKKIVAYWFNGWSL